MGKKPEIAYNDESERVFKCIEKMSPDTKEYTEALRNFVELRKQAEIDSKSKPEKYLEVHGMEMFKILVYTGAVAGLVFLDWHPSNVVSKRLVDIIRRI